MLSPDYAGLRLKSRAVLAPMSGISTLPFRILCNELGAGLTFTEFACAAAIVRNKGRAECKVFDRIKTASEETPRAVQLFSANEKDLVEAIEFVEKDFDLIDLNFGCPSQKIAGGGCGAYLLKEPAKLVALVKTAVECTHKPVTCKFRMGWDKPVLHEFVERVIRAGIQGLAVHARTALQGYSGQADWEYIRKIKALAAVPVIGNGDIHSAPEAQEKLDKGYCDIAMIGRAAWNNPGIFSEVGKKPLPSRVRILERYFELIQKYPFTGLVDIKAQVSGMISGLPHAKGARMRITQAKSTQEVRNAALECVRKASLNRVLT